MRLSFWWRGNEDYVVSSNNDSTKLLRRLGISNILCIFQYKVHVLVEAVESSSHASSPFKLDKYYFVQALFEDLCRNFRHSSFNRRVAVVRRRYSFKDCLSLMIPKSLDGQNNTQRSRLKASD